MLNAENNRNNYILIAEDNPADIVLYQTAFKAIDAPNRLFFALNGELAFELLKKDKEIPFIIISDINMPKMNGIELKEKIEGDYELKIKSIPFVFITSSATTEEIVQAYELAAQGYFLKPMEYNQLELILRRIISYWSEAQLPKVISL
jgi:CheY-like chemotaxis protein